jgi:hypothetical protein
MMDSRPATNRLIRMLDEGILLPETVLTMCLDYMSEDDVADMMRINDIDEDLYYESE